MRILSWSFLRVRDEQYPARTNAVQGMCTMVMASVYAHFRQFRCRIFIDVPEQTYIDGLNCVYELNRVELLRDVYLRAYERSSRRYKTVRDSLPEPDAFRLKYRGALTEVV